MHFPKRCSIIIVQGSLVKRLRRRPLTAETGVRFPYELLFLKKNSPTQQDAGNRMDFGIFCTIGKFVSYRMKTSGGSHCGGKEDVAYATHRSRRIPQEGFFFVSREKLFPALGKRNLHGLICFLKRKSSYDSASGTLEYGSVLCIVNVFSSVWIF